MSRVQANTLVVLLAISCSSFAMAQDEHWQPALTIDGHPDFQGVWATQ